MFIDRFAMNGEPVSTTAGDKVADYFRKNFTRFAIGLNPVVFLKQLTSIPAYAADMPPGERVGR